MRTAICYKTNENKEFLSYYTYKNLEDAKADAEKLNAEKPSKLWNDEPIDWAEVKYFFAEEC